MECSICCLDVKKLVKCPFCDFEACVKCNHEYILGSINTPACMNVECKKQWSEGFLGTWNTKVWMNKTYRKYKEGKILDREMARLEEFYPEYELDKRKKKIENKEKTLRRRKSELEREMKDLWYHSEKVGIREIMEEIDQINIMMNAKHQEFIDEFGKRKKHKADYKFENWKRESEEGKNFRSRLRALHHGRNFHGLEYDLKVRKLEIMNELNEIEVEKLSIRHEWDEFRYERDEIRRSQRLGRLGGKPKEKYLFPCSEGECVVRVNSEGICIACAFIYCFLVK